MKTGIKWRMIAAWGERGSGEFCMKGSEAMKRKIHTYRGMRICPVRTGIKGHSRAWAIYESKYAPLPMRINGFDTFELLSVAKEGVDHVLD